MARHEHEDYQVVAWCVLCGWSTDDPANTVCDCPGGVPHC